MPSRQPPVVMEVRGHVLAGRAHRERVAQEDHHVAVLVAGEAQRRELGDRSGLLDPREEARDLTLAVLDAVPRGNRGRRAAAARRTHHQQWLAFSSCAAPQFDAIHRYKHAITGLTKCISLDGRKHDIACSQIDIGNAVTEMTEKWAVGALQANGETKVEPRLDVKHVAEAVLYMAGLPLDANVQFMTVMATKMPFIGRG